MTDMAWIDATLTAARPQVLGALLRYFRVLDAAEDAFQEACLRALKTWPVKGPPRDPAAWLIFVGRNFALDEVRRRSKQTELPADDEVMSDEPEDTQTELAERLDASHYRDDILRLLFVCCHPDLPATQQVALVLRIVSGLTVKEIARAFLVSESAMEQRITRAKARITAADVPFDTPGAPERATRLSAVSTMIYLLFNEGYSASGGAAIGLASAAAMAPFGSGSFAIAPLRMTVGWTPAGTVTGRWPLPNSRSMRESLIAWPRPSVGYPSAPPAWAEQCPQAIVTHRGFPCRLAGQ